MKQKIFDIIDVGDKMILLVEPGYRNKYPPMGLMKLASYHKSLGDDVVFVKGMNEPKIEYDRIYITTLFTFDYYIVIDTIRYYADTYNCDVYVGGIMSSLLTNKLVEDVEEYNNINIITGQLLSSEKIGYYDEVNIDILPLDYSILSHTTYEYKENSGYMGYTTRGCVNKCEFCAVPILESKFMISNNLTSQVNSIIKHHGEMQNLLLLDNNILGLSPGRLKVIVDEIASLGFERGNMFYGDYKIDSLYKDLINLSSFIGVLNEVINTKLKQFQEELNNIISKSTFKKHKTIYNIYSSWAIRLSRNIMLENYDFICSNSFTKYYNIIKPYYSNRRGAMRKVDFNQGLDARLLTEEKMQILSKINIEPFRLALDDVATIPQYEEAVRLAAKYGVKSFSNYLLYNFEDRPEDLYIRMKVSKDLANELNVNIYSFPMKYAPISDTNRDYIGKYWNKLLLSNYRRILKPTMGIVGKGDSYFKKAFGDSYEEFSLILHMPGNYVTFRNENEKNIIDWKEKFVKLNELEKSNLVSSVVRNKKMSSYNIDELL